MSDIRGVDPQGNPKDVAVDAKGGVYTTARPFYTSNIRVPGIGTAAAYAAADAFGTRFVITVPVEGTIATVVFRDYDDEGLTKELVLFNRDFTETADNSAFAVSDADLVNCVGVVSISTFYNFSSNQIGVALPALYYVAPYGTLWAQFVTRGADNIAAGAIPDFSMVVV